MPLLVKLDTKEKSLMNAITGEDKLSVAVREDLTADELAENIQTAASLISKMEGTASVIKPILGRLLLLASSSEGFLEAVKCKTIGDFDKSLTKSTGLSRATLYDCRKIYEKFPNLPVDRYQEIGSTKLLVAAKFTSQEETGSSKVLKKAETLSVDEFKKWAEDEGYLGKGETTGASLTITGNKSQIKALRSYFDDEACKQHVGSAEPIKLILAAFEEASTEWGGTDEHSDADETVAGEPAEG